MSTGNSRGPSELLLIRIGPLASRIQLSYPSTDFLKLAQTSRNYVGTPPDWSSMAKRKAFVTAMALWERKY